MMKQRAELLLHTKLSDDISVIGAEDIIKISKAFGLSAIAFTNLNNVEDFGEILAYAEYTNAKIIYGAQVICKSDTKPEDQRFTLLVKNQQGVKSLYKILSSIEKREDGNYVDVSVLAENREHLLIGTKEMDAIISSDYVELYPAYDEETRECNRKICFYAREQAKPVVAVSNAHYFLKEEMLYRNIVCASRGLEEEKTARMYIRDTKEMLEECAYLGEDLAKEVVVINTQIIADMIEEVVPITREHHAFEVEGAYEKVEERVVDKAHEIYGKPLPTTVSERLNTELGIIQKRGYASKYLIAQEIANYLSKNQHPFGSRGTVGSTLVNFLLGISNINPLIPHYHCMKCHWFEEQPVVADGLDLPSKQCPVCGEVLNRNGHNIPFEGFMGLEGSKQPQFFLNVSPKIQQHVIEYMRDTFGENNILRFGVVQTLSEAHVQEMVRTYEEQKGVTFSENKKQIIHYYLSGVKNGTGVHPGAIAIRAMGVDVEEFTPVIRGQDGILYTRFSYFDLHDVFERIDILCCAPYEVLEILQQKTGVKMDEITFEDSEILTYIKSMDTLGFYEFDADFMTYLLVRTTPESFSDLVKLSGMAHGTNVWAENGEHLIANGKPLAELPALREEIMNDLLRIGVERDKAFMFSEKVRKGLLANGRIGKETLEEYREMLRPLGDWYFEYCNTIKYMFPKAHAISYVWVEVCLAWFKKHYEKEFIETIY